jgi:hypothetical protein
MKKIKLQAIGAPFDIAHSSCGKRKPKYFTWSGVEEDIKIYIDHALSGGLSGSKEKKYGWTCESKIIAPNVIEDLRDRIDQYKKYYSKIFTFDEELISIDPSFFIYCFAGSNYPWTPDEDYGVHEKTKLVSFLCSTNSMTEGHRYRLSWAEKLKDKVDLYGGACGSNIIGGSHCYHHQKKTEAMKEYMFSIVIENCNVDCYFTEKITDCFANGVIPVYYGSKNITKYFDEKGIIFLEENFDISTLSEDLYNSKLDSVKENFKRIKEIPMSDDMIYLKTLANL